MSPCVMHLKEGGTNSGGSANGSGCPALAISVKCIANMNSSALSCPFPSISASDLGKTYEVH